MSADLTKTATRDTQRTTGTLGSSKAELVGGTGAGSTASGATTANNSTEDVASAGGKRAKLSRARSKAMAHRPLSLVTSRMSTTSSAAAGAGPERELHGFNGVIRAPAKGCEPKAAAELTAEQERKYEQVLAHFRAAKTYPTCLQDKRGTKKVEMRAANDWEALRMLTRESMLRYLRATKWDVEAAKKRLTETIAWRREYGVDAISPEEVEAEAKCGKESVLGFDNHCRPLHYMHPHRNDTAESPRQMRFAVWILEACIDMMPAGVEQLALLINFESKSRNPTSISNAKLMLYILQNHYVERLGIALCINGE